MQNKQTNGQEAKFGIKQEKPIGGMFQSDDLLNLIRELLEAGDENEYVEARLEQVWDRLRGLSDSVFPTLNKRRQMYIVMMILMGVETDEQEYPMYS